MAYRLRDPSPVTQDRFHHAEGPVWDGRQNRLLFVDMLAGDLVAFGYGEADETPHRTVVHVDEVLAFIRPRRRGGWIAGSADSLLTLDEAFAVVDRRTVLSDHRVRFNEGGCGPDGALYAGTMAYDKTPGAGALYRFDAAHGQEVVLAEVTISNGLAPRPNSASMYYIDSATQRVDLITVAADAAVRREPFVTFEPDAGSPDGLTVDAEGGVWVALWGGSRVQRFDHSGQLTHEVELPTTQVSACTFGGPDLSTLFITTSTIGAAADDPYAGAVFAVDVDVRGKVVIPASF